MKTKQLFLAVVLIFTAISATLAQNVDYGIKVGGNYSTLSGYQNGEKNYLPGFHAGLIAEVRLSPTFSLQPELLYSLEGARAEFTYSIGEASFSIDQKIKLGYINLPVIMNYYVFPAFSLHAGPQVGYLVSANSEYDLTSKFPGESQVNKSGEEDIKDTFKKASLGLNVGFGYELQNHLFL